MKNSFPTRRSADLTLEFSTDLFDRTTAEVIVADFRAVMEQVVRTPAFPVADLNALLDAGRAEREELGHQNLRRAGLDRLRQLRDRKSKRLNSSHSCASRMPSSA